MCTRAIAVFKNGTLALFNRRFVSLCLYRPIVILDRRPVARVLFSCEQYSQRGCYRKQSAEPISNIRFSTYYYLLTPHRDQHTAGKRHRTPNVEVCEDNVIKICTENETKRNVFDV